MTWGVTWLWHVHNSCVQLMCLCDGGDGMLDKHCNMNFFFVSLVCFMVPPDSPDGSDSKASAYNMGDPGSVPGLGRSPGEGNGNLLQHSCLENPTGRGAWQATVHGVAKSRTGLSDFTFTFHAK